MAHPPFFLREEPLVSFFQNIISICVPDSGILSSVRRVSVVGAKDLHYSKKYTTLVPGTKQCKSSQVMKPTLPQHWYVINAVSYVDA